MRRDGYKIFSEGKIGNIELPNRLVRSATSSGIARTGKVPDEVLRLYKELAEGGVGMIITGITFVAEKGEPNTEMRPTYHERHIEGIERIAEVVHNSASGCKIVAQVEAGVGKDAGASCFLTPFPDRKVRPLCVEEIRNIEDCFVGAICRLKEAGFDGVQLHAAHGYFLSRFLSPYMNCRSDDYGGSARNRARIVREIVSKAREKVGDFPILIKMNCTDHVEGGIDIDTFPEMAREIETAGVNAIEVSGGIVECLVRTEEELGFRPFPDPESHTRINTPEKQCYHLKYAEKLELGIPVILVGGNRDIERLDKIVQQGKVAFIALCRPLISEPDLPNRWLEGQGSNTTDCISCNSCLYPLIGPEEYTVPYCVFKQGKQRYKMAQSAITSRFENQLRQIAKPVLYETA